MLPRTFSTARLLARALRAEDEPIVHRMHRDAAQMEHLGGVRDEAQTRSYMERNLAHWSEFGFGLWLLYDPSDGGEGAVVGRVLLRHLDLDGVDEVEVGYSLLPSRWGRGLAAEATTACLEMARDRLRRETVVALTAPGNLRSHRVLQKVGMELERPVLYEGSEFALFRTVWLRDPIRSAGIPS
jgi:RimJ/RimL family protein N-acetyltransferase